MHLVKTILTAVYHLQHTNCPQLNQRARGHRRAGIKHHVQRVAIPGQRLGQRAVVRRVGHRHRLKAVGDDKPRFSIGFVLNDPARRDLSDGVKFFRVVFRLGKFQHIVGLGGGGQKQTGGEKDDKIIAVPASKIDPTYDDIKTISDLPKIEQQRLEAFFRVYKELPEGRKKVELAGFNDAAAAKQEIKSAWEAWKAKNPQ